MSPSLNPELNPSWKPNPLRAVRNHLISQIVFFDEQHTAFVDQYFSGESYIREKRAVETMIRRYTEAIERLLAGDDAALAEVLHTIVVIGSMVTIEFEDDGYEESYTLVYPSEMEPDENKISFLSPLGRQLLLSLPGTEVSLETPAGVHRITVRDTRFSYIGGFAKV